jgi:hypothetical protein
MLKAESHHHNRENVEPSVEEGVGSGAGPWTGKLLRDSLVRVRTDPREPQAVMLELHERDSNATDAKGSSLSVRWRGQDTNICASVSFAGLVLGSSGDKAAGDENADKSDDGWDCDSDLSGQESEDGGGQRQERDAGEPASPVPFKRSTGKTRREAEQEATLEEYARLLGNLRDAKDVSTATATIWDMHDFVCNAADVIGTVVGRRVVKEALTDKKKLLGFHNWNYMISCATKCLMAKLDELPSEHGIPLNVHRRRPYCGPDIVSFRNNSKITVDADDDDEDTTEVPDCFPCRVVELKDIEVPVIEDIHSESKDMDDYGVDDAKGNGARKQKNHGADSKKGDPDREMNASGRKTKSAESNEKGAGASTAKGKNKQGGGKANGQQKGGSPQKKNTQKGGGKGKKEVAKKKPEPELPQDKASLKIAKEICDKIGEPKIVIIHAIVEKIGEDAAREVLNETLDVETKGGMMTADNSKRRTPGGVFFVLIKKKLSNKQMKAIFALDKK